MHGPLVLRHEMEAVADSLLLLSRLAVEQAPEYRSAPLHNDPALRLWCHEKLVEQEQPRALAHANYLAAPPLCRATGESPKSEPSTTMASGSHTSSDDGEPATDLSQSRKRALSLEVGTPPPKAGQPRARARGSSPARKRGTPATDSDAFRFACRHPACVELGSAAGHYATSDGVRKHGRSCHPGWLASLGPGVRAFAERIAALGAGDPAGAAGERMHPLAAAAAAATSGLAASLSTASGELLGRGLWGATQPPKRQRAVRS